MDLRDLYQEVILDHSRQPRNFSRPEETNRQAHGDNPLCGDRIAVFLKVKNGVVQEVGFEGRGCAISTASASLMTEAVKGRPLREVRDLFERFHGVVTGEAPLPDADDEGIGKLAVLSGVRDYPVRVKCATLAWHTLVAAMDQSGEKVTTE